MWTMTGIRTKHWVPASLNTAFKRWLEPQNQHVPHQLEFRPPVGLRWCDCFE